MIAKNIAWVLIVGLTLITVVPASARPLTGLQHDLEHFIAFAAAGFFFGWAYRLRLATLLGCIVAFALILELFQIPLTTRHARIEDFIFNSMGAAVGALAVFFGRKQTSARTSEAKKL